MRREISRGKGDFANRRSLARLQGLLKGGEMPTTDRELRAKLFDQYATNFGAYWPGNEPLFGCPLCFRVFGVEALEGEEDGGVPLLSIEHVLPEAVGGKIKTLTCRECNSRDGTKIDSHLVERFRFEDSVAGLSGEPVKARVRAEGADKDLAVDWYIRGDGEPHFVFSGVPKASHPDAPADTMRALSERQVMMVSFEGGYIELRSRIALLRSAYLMLFRYFGYGYMRYGTAEAVRKQIREYENELIGPHAILPFDTAPFPGEMNQLYVVCEPAALRCFFVALEADAARNRYFGVVMPGLDTESLDVYDRWEALGEEASGLKLSPLAVPYDTSYMSDPQKAMAAMVTWEEVIRRAFAVVDGVLPPETVLPQPAPPQLMYAPDSGDRD
jgi:hypothetical protein